MDTETAEFKYHPNCGYSVLVWSYQLKTIFSPHIDLISFFNFHHYHCSNPLFNSLLFPTSSSPLTAHPIRFCFNHCWISQCLLPNNLSLPQAKLGDPEFGRAISRRSSMLHSSHGMNSASSNTRILMDATRGWLTGKKRKQIGCLSFQNLRNYLKGWVLIALTTMLQYPLNLLRHRWLFPAPEIPLFENSQTIEIITSETLQIDSPISISTRQWNRQRLP